MNIFYKVTLESLKKNKTRTIVTIIGIVLSAAMICAVTTFTSSMKDYVWRGNIYRDGAWHGSENSTYRSIYETVVENDAVEEAVYLQNLGFAFDENTTYEYKPYLYVLGASEDVEALLSVHLVEGTYPSSASEIILPTHMLSNASEIYEVGDTITLELGERMRDGVAMTQRDPSYAHEQGEEIFFEEKIAVRETRTYTIVGFYERLSYRIEPYSAPGYTVLTRADEDFPDNYNYDIYFQMKKPKEIYDFMEENHFSGSVNTEVLMSEGSSRYSTFYSVLYSLAAIVTGLIMFGSVSLIYNAFSISISERTKQFGLLSSIGATKKQLRKMVFFEAFAVAAVGIPLGILSGIAGIGVTLMLIGNKFEALGMKVEMKLCVSALSIVIAVLVALVTVLISAWIPSRRATKISAVEAIRQNTDIKVTGKYVKTSKLTYKLFGLPGVLASKHYKRSRKKYRTTIMSLFMSIVLFVSASAFTSYLMESVTGGFATEDYDLWFMGRIEEKTPEEMLELFRSDEHVTEAAGTMGRYVSGRIEERFLNKDIAEELFGDEMSAPAELGQIVEGDSGYDMAGYITFVSDDEFRKLLETYDLNESEYMNPEKPLAIAIDGNRMFNREEGRYTWEYILNTDVCEMKCAQYAEYKGYHYVQEIEIDGEKYVRYAENEYGGAQMDVPYEEAYLTYTLKSGKTIYEYPYFVQRDRYGVLQMLYPMSLYEAVFPENMSQNYEPQYYFYMKSEDHAESCENLKMLLLKNGFLSSSIQDYAASVESSKNLVLIIQVFSYGFIVLISLIAAANVFNTISTNISLRRREFAMLKSVGMPEKGFRQMMNYECLLYGSKALLLGLPVSCAVTYLIYLSIREGYETTFRLPWGAIGIAVLSVFVVVSVTMMYSMSKIRKDNPIDALKNENL